MSHFNNPGDLTSADRDALSKQHDRIREFMLDGAWRTLSEIADELGYPESSVSAQLRHLRKPRFGSYAVERRRRAGCTRLYEYRVLPPAQAQADLFGGAA